MNALEELFEYVDPDLYPLNGLTVEVRLNNSDGIYHRLTCHLLDSGLPLSNIRNVDVTEVSDKLCRTCIKGMRVSRDGIVGVNSLEHVATGLSDATRFHIHFEGAEFKKVDQAAEYLDNKFTKLGDRSWFYGLDVGSGPDVVKVWRETFEREEAGRDRAALGALRGPLNEDYKRALVAAGLVQPTMTRFLPGTRAAAEAAEKLLLGILVADTSLVMIELSTAWDESNLLAAVAPHIYPAVVGNLHLVPLAVAVGLTGRDGVSASFPSGTSEEEMVELIKIVAVLRQSGRSGAYHHLQTALDAALAL